ncbi:hypothetical protein BJ508DRAFT_323073 [Ascobolus immersus RN42]|uniref:F-box domain-containing protein n=1 Tax=Ascobolus immersus RN42 TaxID=1160509 RepID=A0A3N4IL21_ASCIM|nr:hypothetical protein BJ508DRAFT_323073 [Ascobolus immersus RN42]
MLSRFARPLNTLLNSTFGFLPTAGDTTQAPAFSRETTLPSDDTRRHFLDDNDYSDELDDNDYSDERVGLCSMPFELLVEIANKLDDWRDFQAFAQVNRTTRQSLRYWATSFREWRMESHPRLVMNLAQEIMVRHDCDVVLDIKRLCGIKLDKSTGTQGYGYELHDEKLVTNEENTIWFRNMVCLISTLRRLPLSKYHELFEHELVSRSPHPENRRFLRNHNTRSPLGLINFIRNLLLSDQRMELLPPLRLRLFDLMQSMAVVFGNGLRMSRDLVFVDCDSLTDPEQRHRKPVFEGPDISMDGFVARKVQNVDLLLLVQYYRLVARMLSTERHSFDAAARREFFAMTDEVVEEVEEFWCHLSSLVRMWKTLDKMEDRGEFAEMYVCRIGGTLF